jgi:tripartite-type tricarboxylate transporter receptor subunit TctC
MADLVGGHIAVTSTALTSAAGTISGGKVRPLALTAAKRLPDFADIPTYAEQGYPDLVSNVWFALSGPKGMPADIVDKINAAVVKGLQAPDVQARLRLEGITPEPMTSAQFTAFLKAQYGKWGPVAREAIAKK